MPNSDAKRLILSSHLRLGLPSGVCPLGFPTNTLYTPGRIILDCCLKKRTGLIWLRLGIISKLLWTRQWTFGFYNMQRIYWIIEEVLAPLEGLWSTDFLRGTNCVVAIVTKNLESWHVLLPSWSPVTIAMCLVMDFSTLDETHLNTMGQLRSQFLNRLSLRSCACMFLFTVLGGSAGYNLSPWQHKLLHHLNLRPTTLPLVCRLLKEAILYLLFTTVSKPLYIR
jgi:hypothetical protein